MSIRMFPSWLSGAVAFAIVGCSASISAAREPPVCIAASAKPKLVAGASHLGVFGFDGTNTNAEDRSVIYRFVDEARVGDKRYFAGTDLPASTHDRIVNDGVKEICARHDASPFDGVFLTGYSRGAVAALEVASRLATACSSPVPVRWLGLVDAVASSIEASLQRGNAGRDSIGTRCFHLIKTHEALPFLVTAGVVSCERYAIDDDHVGIAGDERTLRYLRADAASVSQGIFDVACEPGAPPASPQTQACSANDSLFACFNARCAWSNGRCGAVDVPSSP